jgi:Alpha/beta hydrolase domain
VPALPTVEGPITGPAPMYPGIRALPPGTAPEDFGYVTEEYFVSGTAAGQPYRTRVVIRRPSNPRRFSGLVQAEPTHFSGNALIYQAARVGIMKRGHLAVDIAARNTSNITLFKAFNPERYASLAIAAPAQTNEILAQVGELLERNAFGHGLARYRVRHVVLSGTSDSSNVVRGYLGAHAVLRMPDGGPIYDGFLLTATLGNTPLPVVADVPMIQMPTQTEVNANAAAGDAYRRSDSDAPGNRFRLYEVAGMPHADSRDSPPVGPGTCDLDLSSVPYGAFTFLGLQHLFDWIAPDLRPPRMRSPIAVDNDLANDGSRLALDELGNANAGVRNTYVDVPVATYGVPNTGPGTCNLLGYELPLPASTLARLYPSRGAYITRVDRRLIELIRERWFPREYGDVVRDDARRAANAPGFPH